MNVEMALRSALVTISQLHIMASESGKMAQAMELLSKAIQAITAEKEERANEDHNGQRKDV